MPRRAAADEEVWKMAGRDEVITTSAAEAGDVDER